VVQRTIEVSARFVVAADGHHSLVRRLLGIENERAADPEYYVVYEFEAAKPLPDELALVLDHGAASVLWPLAGGRGRWSFQLAEVKEAMEFAEKDRQAGWGEPASISERTRKRFQDRLATRVPWFTAGVKDVHWAVDIQFQHRLARQFGRDRCWLVGDAAHQTSPAGIQSMNVGLLEAEDLAGTLVRILRHGASADLLLEYSRTHQAEWRQLLGLNGGPPASNKANEWVRENAVRILRCLPAARTELGALLAQAGLSLPG
jgi:2-polyprenyl-6-methoxyphenol hydroxylase-like FAD-dependent oxidoreductase